MQIKLGAGFLKFPQLLKTVEQQLLPTAHRRALQKTLTTLKTQARSLLKTQYQLPAKALKPRIKTTLSTNQQSGVLWIGLAPIAVDKLGTPQQTAQGVKVAGKTFNHAFVATMPNGHRGVYQRKTTQRLPIKTVTVPLKGAEALLRQGIEQIAAPTYQHYLAQCWNTLKAKTR